MNIYLKFRELLIQNELKKVESEISNLEKGLAAITNNPLLVKNIKSRMNLLIRKSELLEYDLSLVMQEMDKSNRDNKMIR
jgi:hypothetical protein